MSQLSEILKKKEFIIAVSLPKHDITLAKTAMDYGADVIKVHANVHHKASGTHFGTWSQEKSIIQKIIQAVSIPVGLMAGAEQTVSAPEMQEAIELGIDFIDIYDFHMPCWMLSVPIGKMIAVGEDFTVDEAQSLEDLGMDFLEASIIPASQYRTSLTARDITKYQLLVNATKRPVFIPSQKVMEPEHLSLFKEIGIQGVILGTIALGDTAAEFARRLPFFTKLFA